MLELAARATILSRAVAGPPGLDAARVPELRNAFDATMKDSAYLADMKKRKMQMIDRMTWQEVESFIAETAATPKPIQGRFRTLLGIKG